MAEHYARLRRRLGGPLAEAAARLLQQSEAYVRQLMTPAEVLEGEEEPPEPVEYRHFLLLKLPPRRPDLQGLRALLADVIQRPAAALAALSTGIPEVVDGDWRAALLAEQELQHRLRALLPVRPVEGETLQWLLRRPFWRGLGEPPLRPGWRPSVLLRAAGGQVRLAPAPSEVVTLAERLLDVRLRHLVVEQDTPEGERWSYQAFLALSQLPDRLDESLGQRLSPDAQEIDVWPEAQGLESTDRGDTLIGHLGNSFLVWFATTRSSQGDPSLSPGPGFSTISWDANSQGSRPRMWCKMVTPVVPCYVVNLAGPVLGCPGAGTRPG